MLMHVLLVMLAVAMMAAPPQILYSVYVFVFLVVFVFANVFVACYGGSGNGGGATLYFVAVMPRRLSIGCALPPTLPHHAMPHHVILDPTMPCHTILHL